MRITHYTNTVGQVSAQESGSQEGAHLAAAGPSVKNYRGAFCSVRSACMPAHAPSRAHSAPHLLSFVSREARICGHLLTVSTLLAQCLQSRCAERRRKIFAANVEDDDAPPPLLPPLFSFPLFPSRNTPLTINTLEVGSSELNSPTFPPCESF